VLRVTSCSCNTIHAIKGSELFFRTIGVFLGRDKKLYVVGRRGFNLDDLLNVNFDDYGVSDDMLENCFERRNNNDPACFRRQFQT